MSLVTARHADELARGIQTLGLDIDAATQQRLLDYLALLAKWNKAYNLTAVRDVDEMVSRHLLDSLSIVAQFEAAGGERWLDVGSGGGMPGIPLAILFPAKSLTLLDSNGKKTRFLTQVKLELKLDNLQVIHSRVEAFQPGLRSSAPGSGVRRCAGCCSSGRSALPVRSTRTAWG